MVLFAGSLWGADDLFVESLENRDAFVSEGGIVFVTQSRYIEIGKRSTPHLGRFENVMLPGKSQVFSKFVNVCNREVAMYEALLWDAR